MKPSDSSPNLLAEFFASDKTTAPSEPMGEMAKKDSDPFIGEATMRKSAPPPPPSMRSRKSQPPPARGNAAIGLPLAARPRSIPPRPPSARHEPTLLDETDIDLEWDVEDQPPKPALEISASEEAETATEAKSPSAPEASPDALAAPVSASADSEVAPSTEETPAPPAGDTTSPSIVITEGPDADAPAPEAPVETVRAEEVPLERPAASDVVPEEPAFFALRTDGLPADDPTKPVVAEASEGEAKLESPTSPDSDFSALVLASVSDTDLTRPLPSPFASEDSSEPRPRLSDHPTPLDPSPILSGAPALPALPPISVRRPPLAAPVPAPARRPSVPPPPVSGARGFERATIPPPKSLPLPKPPPRPGQAQVPFVISAPPRATKSGPTENTPTIQITAARGDGSSDFTPTVQIDRLRVPSFWKGSPDREPTLPRGLPPPGPEVDRDARTASIAPVSGSVAPPSNWRRPPLWKADRRRLGVSIAAAVFGVGALALALRPRAGELTVTASAADGSEIRGLSVLVDGVEQCNKSPCEVKDMKAGTHLVSASAPGFEASAQRAIVVNSGEHAAQHVALSTEERAHSELSVAALGSDLHVIVDGRDLGAPPITIRDVSSGTHAVRVEGAAGYYQPYEEVVNIEPGELRSLGPVRLHVLKGRLELLPGPGSDGAAVAVDGRRIGHIPTTMDLSANDAHEVVAHRPGYSDFSRQVVFDGTADQAVEVALSAGEADTSSPAHDLVRSIPGSSAHSTVHVATTVAPPSGGPGFLDINSKPPALVVLNGRPMGMSPLHGVRVDAGHQTIVFVSPELGRRVASATVTPGGRAKVAVSF